MAFYSINKASKFGQSVVIDANLAQRLKDSVNIQLSRFTEMTDAQFVTEYGAPTTPTALTRSDMITTYTALQTALAASAFTNLITKIG